MPTLAYWQGRTKEQAQLHTWLRDTAVPLIGIYGLGGFGKSTLAARVYEDSTQKDSPQDSPQDSAQDSTQDSAQGSAPFVGQFWADLSQTLGFPDVARRALFAWGMPAEEVAAFEETQLPTALVRRLGSGAYLLVLDNLESVLTEQDEWQSVAYRQFFEAFLRTAGASKVLLTSRNRLPGLPARWLALTEGLTSVEGAALLSQKGVLGSDAERQSVSERVGGYPLSLVLIAGWLLAEEPADPQVRYLPGDLWALEGRYQGARQLSVEAVFGWSVGRLEERLRQVLWQLSILRQPFSATTAAAVAPDQNPSEADLRQLDRRALLQLLPEQDRDGQRRFRWQAQVRELAQRRAGDQSAAHERAIRHFAGRVQPLQQAQENQRQTETDQLQDYLEVFHHLCELGGYGAALGWLTQETQAGETYSSCDFWMQLSGYNDLREALYRRLVEEWRPQDEERRGYGYAQEKLGDVLQFLDQREAAIALYDEAIATYQQVGDRLGYANALCSRASLLDDAAAALEAFQQAQQIYIDINHPYSQARNLILYICRAQAALGQVDSAIDSLQQAAAIGEAIGVEMVVQYAQQRIAELQESDDQAQEP